MSQLSGDADVMLDLGVPLEKAMKDALDNKNGAFFTDEIADQFANKETSQMRYLEAVKRKGARFKKGLN